MEKAWDYVSRILSVEKASRSKPYLKKLFYIRGILRNRLSYVNERMAMELMEDCVEREAFLESLERLAKKVRTWTEWRNALEDYIAGHSDETNPE